MTDEEEAKALWQYLDGDHYTGADGEIGCGSVVWLLVVAALIIVIFVIWVLSS